MLITDKIAAAAAHDLHHVVLHHCQPLKYISGAPQRQQNQSGGTVLKPGESVLTRRTLQSTITKPEQSAHIRQVAASEDSLQHKHEVKQTSADTSPGRANSTPPN